MSLKRRMRLAVEDLAIRPTMEGLGASRDQCEVEWDRPEGWDLPAVPLASTLELDEVCRALGIPRRVLAGRSGERGP